MRTVKSPDRLKRERDGKKRQDNYWKKKNGPVTTRIATPEELAHYKRK